MDRLMHTEYDTQTVTNTLALYGVKHRSPLYRHTQALVRMVAYTAAIVSVVTVPHIIAYLIIPA